MLAPSAASAARARATAGPRRASSASARTAAWAASSTSGRLAVAERCAARAAAQQLGALLGVARRRPAAKAALRREPRRLRSGRLQLAQRVAGGFGIEEADEDGVHGARAVSTLSGTVYRSGDGSDETLRRWSRRGSQAARPDRGAPGEGAAGAQGPEALQAALDACLRLLRARAQQPGAALALERRGFSALTQGEALERLRGWGYLDDARFARDRAAACCATGGSGPAAVLQRLAGARGGGDAAARAAVAAASEAVDFDPLEAAARQVLEKRRLLPPRPEPAAEHPKEQARAARLLLGRGFSEDVVAAAAR